MSTKTLVKIFYAFIITLQVMTHQSISIPLPNRQKNITNSRQPRLLGKFSIVAGLNLPGHSMPPPSISRNDLLYERLPNQVTFNYPANRWGPYVAAVYEPLPLVSFFHNPIGFLASALNPFNWFGSGVTSSDPTASPAPSKDHDDVVLLLDDSKNEIPNEDRAMDKPTIKFTKEVYKSHKNPTTPPTTSSYLNDFVTTIEGNEETPTDLEAEETTLNLIERIKNITQEVADGRQGLRPTTRTTLAPTTPTTVAPGNMTTANAPTSSGSGVGNVTAVPQQNTTSSPSQTYPTHPTYWNGYYYGGYPQNVSHLEFTTPRSPNFNPVSHQIKFEQQLPSFDFFGGFDNNFLTGPGSNYHANDRNLEHNDFSGENWYPNGFKPSLNFRF